MAMRMLIDARHPEETRVAVLKGNRIEEFDFESAEHKQIKGNIYLAKVTRVEPSLQAAFVDFGGNRHGFLAFSEIHPDYYQIPHADREALLAEDRAAAEEEEALRAEEDELESAGANGGVEEIDTSDKDDVATIEGGQIEDPADGAEDHDGSGAGSGRDSGDEGEEGENARRAPGRNRRQGGRRGNESRAREMDKVRAKRQELRHRYKIQDVIQRRQVLLVQVVKEERGNKGAALTTYLSLAGRYCVLMPNSSHGGGISRKISSGQDRNRLKQIVSDLSLPRSMGLIVRTAGLQRTKTEIKRDFDYLARLWDGIRERTLNSSAPSMIHSDSDLVKRAIRDIYHREIDEVIVEGDEGYKSAKAFMKLLMPSHARRVKHYSNPVPLFQRYGAEDQLSAMYDPTVQLKSGGYLIINPTEALVSIDINSGRSTKEHGIEQTALHTNLEAAHEIARQLRLRDMAGLVVIDFIDMESSSNIRKVERALKEALKNDRARIQIGRISGFGLMEMSRQRLRTGVLEATTRSCPHCDGTGLVRTASSAGLSALRLIEEEAAKGKGTRITLYASTEASVYLLNAKRRDLAEIENRYGVEVEVQPEGEDEGAKMRVTSSGPPPAQAPRFEPIIDDDDDDDDIADEDEAIDDEEDAEPRPQPQAEGRKARQPDEDQDSRRKGRRRRRGGRGRNRQDDGHDESQDDGRDEGAGADELRSDLDESETPGEDRQDDEPRADKSKRRRRRGGRGRNRRGSEHGDQGDGEAQTDGDEPAAGPETGVTQPPQAEEAGGPTDPAASNDQPETTEPDAAEGAANADEAEQKPKRRTRRKKADPAPENESAEPAAEDAAADVAADPVAAEEPTPAAKPKRTRKRKAEPAAPSAPPGEDAPAGQAMPAPQAADLPGPAPLAEADTADPADLAVPADPPAEEPARQADEQATSGGAARRGWWQRTFGD